jgi:hypothetical protein
MIEYKYADLFTQDTVDKQVLIEYDGGVITNTELFSESMELTETLCSESELRFGACEASVIKFKIGNMLTSLIGKWITVKMYLNGNASNPLQIGRYKVYSDKPTADRKWRDIVAYDAMYDIINTNVADWYNTILPNENSTISMKAFRTGFLNHFGITQEQTDLVNDSMVVAKTIQPDAISGKDVITAICEINGCFGHISRDGKFRYVYLKKDIRGLYPKNDLYPDNNLFPRNPNAQNIGINGGYISANYEDFTTQTIDKLQIRKEEDDIGVIIGGDTSQNSYIIEDNFLVYGKSTEELRVVANNIFNKITGLIYRPYNATVRGNPCVEVGDAVRLVTRYELIESYVLQRTLKGVQALRDNFSAKGVEIYGQKINSLHRSIIELKGKTNVLTRTIEETQSTITDVENGLQTQITQNSNSITLEVKRAEQAELGLKNDYESKIKQTADEISTQIIQNTQIFEKENYQISYEKAKDPDIDANIGEYWLNTLNGKLYVGVSIPTTWEYLGQFHSATLASGESAGQQRWYLVGEGKSIYNKYGDRAGFNMTKYGGFDADPPKDDNYPIGSWWMDIDRNSASTITLQQYLADLNISYPDDYMMLYEKTANSRNEWQYVKTLGVITLSEMQSQISQNADSINLKVSKGNVSSEISQESGQVKIKAGRFIVESDYLDINKNGTSGEIVSKNGSGRYIKFNTGGLEGGYNGTAKCKIQCSDAGLAFRGASMTFCMDNIYVGTSMNATKTNKAYTGDIAYVAPTDGDVTKLNAAVLHVWNGLVLDNDTYS